MAGLDQRVPDRLEEVQCGEDSASHGQKKAYFDPSKFLSFKRGYCISLEDNTHVTLYEYCSRMKQRGQNWKWIVRSSADPKRKLAHMLDSIVGKGLIGKDAHAGNAGTGHEDTKG